MYDAFITIGLAFIEGLALILSPCILPILPIILAGSLTGSKKRPLGIICGFILTFALFSYFAHNLIQYTDLNLNTIRHAAYLFLFLFGITLLSTYLSEWFNQLASKLASIGHNIAGQQRKNNGFISGLCLGAIVSLIWTPCAGPILATVIVQIAIQKESVISFFTLLFFALGAAIPMFVIAFYSLHIRDGVLFFKKHALLFRKALGLIIILNVGYMIAQEFGYGSSPTFSQAGIRTTNYLQDSLWRPYPAPAIAGISSWINSPPIELSQLKGKVVLIDFWTYSCINCLRTLPYLKDWYSRYHQQGLVIIGVHSPEFDFEKNLNNVKNAVKQDGIDYPVALDNNFVTWRNFSNHYWPAHYLINKEGKVVYEHFGEGNYDKTENNIRFLLGEAYSPNTDIVQSPQYSYFLTPETYLGYARSDSNANTNLVHDQISNYSFPKQLPKNAWALQGGWQVNADKLTSMDSHAALTINFNARTVYIVMGTNNKTAHHVNVLLNNKPLTTEQGKSVLESQIIVEQDTIYHVLTFPKMTQGVLEIIPKEPGLEVYTFTFGS